MSMIGFEIAIVLLLVIVNGIFAMSEIAVVSVRKARLQQRAEAGDRGAERAIALAEEPTRFLATVQVGITLVGVLAGAFGGATIAGVLSGMLLRYPLLAPYAEALALGIVVVCITYLSLIIGELVPKQIGLNHPERIAVRIAGPMNLLSRLASPLVTLLTVSTTLVLRVLRVREATDATVTEQEITVMINEGTRAGVFHEDEQDMVERVFWLGDRRAADLFTPRRRVAWVDVRDGDPELRAKMIAQRHDVYLVCDGTLDHVLGVIGGDDLMLHLLRGEPLDVQALMKQPLFVPENIRALRLLDLFRDSGIGLAVVVDEYGGVEGVITRDDLLEDMAGEVAATDPQIVRRDDGSYLMDGAVSIDEFRDLLGLDERREDERADYRSVGGLIFTQLGRIPRTGEHIEVEGLRLEVVDMDGPRIDKVLVTSASAAPSYS